MQVLPYAMQGPNGEAMSFYGFLARPVQAKSMTKYHGSWFEKGPQEVCTGWRCTESFSQDELPMMSLTIH